MEHRWGQRRSTDVMVRFFNLPATIGMGRMLNISPTGAFLETSAKLRRLSLVYLEPAAPLSTQGRLGRIAACVVRQDATGVGLEWCGLDAKATQVYAHLANLPVKTAGVPKELLHETAAAAPEYAAAAGPEGLHRLEFP
jgi:hypothetical protein